MGLSTIDGRERTALAVSVLLVFVVFSAAFYNYLYPPQQVWVIKVFEVVEAESHTVVSSYGGGYLKLKGTGHNLEEGSSYRITYTSRRRNWAENVISIEKIS